MAQPANNNGFDLSGISLPIDEVFHGGPPRDGIPSIDDPKFTGADEAEFSEANEPVLAIYYNEEAKAYPIRIMDYHEIVNDQFGESGVVVSYCPLCGSGVAFNSDIADQRLTFGVSGLLYNSDVLMYDRETESLWSQLIGESVSGKMKGTAIELVPMEYTTLGEWLKRYPETLVLSTETGYVRDYKRVVYSGYTETEALYFPVNNSSDQMFAKTRVIGLEIDGKFKAFPMDLLAKTNGTIKDTFAGQELLVHYNGNANSAYITDEKEHVIPTTNLFWFAWFAFHPETEVWLSPN